MRIPIVFKLLALSFFSSLIIILILSYNSYTYRYQELQNKFGLALKHIALSTAADIRGEKHNFIKKRGDEKRPEFREIQEVLQRKRMLHGIQPDNIYTLQLTRDPANIPFAVMLHPKPFIADNYKPPPEVQRIMKKAYDGKAVRTTLYTTSFGRWISGIAPIRDSRGRVVGLLQVDYKVRKFFAALRVQYIRILFTGGVVAVLGLLLSLLIANSLSRPIKQLETASRAVQAGDYDTHITMLTNDEFRVLGDTFNSMVASIKESRDRQEVYAQSLESMVQERTLVLIEAKAEADTILRNVTDGIFLLREQDGRLIIANEHSRALSAILENPEVAGSDFIEQLERHVNPDTVRMTKTYLEHMLNPRFDEESLEALNPLESVEFSFRGERLKRKFLKFKFRRVLLDRRITQLMGVVSDGTEQRRLERELEETDRSNRHRMSMLFQLLHVDAFLLSVFLEDAEVEIDIINNLLRDFRPDADGGQLLEGIYQSVHTIKGNAALMELEFLAEPAHVFEETIEELRGLKNPRGEQLLPLAVQLSQLSRTLEEVSDLFKRLREFQAGFQARSAGTGLMLMKSIEKTTTALGQSMGKDIRVDYGDFDYENMPNAHRKTIKDALIQLARNSIKHGIENAEERTQAGKPEQGLIRVSSRTADGYFILTYRDDGRGLQTDEIKARGIASGEWTREEVAQWTSQDISRAIFTAGISTASGVDHHAGRGRGMGLILAAVNNAGGRLETNFEEGIYCEFVISLPIASAP